MTVNYCLVCGEGLERSTRKRQVFPTELGNSGAQVVDNVCKVLQLPFLEEIQGEWTAGGKDNKVPFCGNCLNEFAVVIKLQQQLEEIRRRVEQQISTIRGKIQEANRKGAGGDARTTRFRLKALAVNHLGGTKTEVLSTSDTQLNPALSSSLNYNAFQQTVGHPGSTQASLWLQQEKLFNVASHSSTCIPPTSAASSSDNDPSTYQNFQSWNGMEDATGDDDNHNYSDNDSESDREWNATSSGVGTGITTTSSSTSKTRKASTRTSKQDRQPEYFAPILTDNQGRMTYEGIIITPIANGYSCGSCQAKIGKDHSTLSLRKAKIHIKGFHLSAYKCTLCDKNFTSNDILNQHLDRIHDKNLEPCPVCGKPTHDRYLKHHLFTHMNFDEKQIALANGLKVHGYTEMKGYTKKEPHLPCRICGKLFGKKGRLAKHEMSHVDAKFRKDHECTYCQKRFADPATLRFHVRVNHEGANLRKQLCKVCGELVIPKHLNVHMKKHKRHECPNCGLSMSGEKTVQNHLKLCLERYKRPGYDHECNLCGKCFATRKLLTNHRRKTHGKRVELPGHLEGKMRLLEDKTFQCTFCPETVKTVEEAKEHYRMNHGMNRMKLYQCEICERTAMPQNGFRKHLWRHKNVEELVEAVNQGEKLPTGWKEGEEVKILKEIGVEVEIKCGICEKKDFQGVEELHTHRWKEHPDAPVKKVTLLKNPKKIGSRLKYPEGEINCPRCGKTFRNSKRWRNHVYKVHKREREKVLAMLRLTSDENGAKARKKRKIKVQAEEDEEENEVDDHQRVEVKMEVDSAQEEEQEVEMGFEGRRRKSLRNRGEQKRYAEEDEDEEPLGVKQSPPSSADEEEDEYEESD